MNESHSTNILTFEGAAPRVVSFGGFDGLFDWDRRLSGLGVAALCLKDSRRRWYLDGCDGFDEQATLQLIGNYVRNEPCVFIGQSAGGYAALRYADRFNAHVIAFAPQTFYDASCKTRTPADLPDIRALLVDQHREASIDIYVAQSEDENPPEAYFWNDRLQIAGLERAQNLSVHVEPTHKHPCAYYLAQMGRLNQILMDGIARARWS